mgnify:CR=1 FL=1
MQQHLSEKEIQNVFPNLYRVDNAIDKLVKKIELLSYVNPSNIETEKQRFFASKYTENPKFKYPKLGFDAFKLQQSFFTQPLESLENSDLQKLYQDIVYYYSNMIQCIQTIGEPRKFYYNSLRVFGSPNERDVKNAQFILHFDEDGTHPNDIKKYSPAEAKAYFENFVSHYNFPISIKYSNSIASDAMVQNSTKSLLIKRNATFSENQLQTLANHEIGIHLVTTYNAALQPLKIFSNGLPRNVETQEGLAVFSEYMCGALSLKRIKELAYRVIASDSLIKGYSFTDTFDLIHNQYKLNRNDAYTITLRAHRGGGFTKDRLYLSGLRKIYQRYQERKDMDNLLTGKVNAIYEPEIETLKSYGLVAPVVHRPTSYAQNLNTNTTIDFILNNLR